MAFPHLRQKPRFPGLLSTKEGSLNYGHIKNNFSYCYLGIVDSNEEVKRKNTPCIFTNALTKQDFAEIAVSVAKPIKRLTVSVHDEFVEGEVRTSSGINTWTFKLDFNDYGKIPGNYWFRYCDNSDSQIPKSYAEQLKKAIVEHKQNR